MDSLLSPGYCQTTKFGTGPDFSIYTGAMRPIETKDLPDEDQDKPVVRMCGSSVVEDLMKDTMNLSALQDMTKIPANLTFWLNHSYQLPDDAYGKLYGRPKIEVLNLVADLWVAAETFMANPQAEKTYNLIKRDGARIGCSIGCMVTDWSWINEEDKWNSGISIDHVYVLEFSLVGVPANQRCWVENALKGIFARSLVEGNGDIAKDLAPAFRGLFTRQYDEVLRNVTSEGLRKDLERVPVRGSAQHRIIYDFDGIEGFAVRDLKGMKKSLSREEVPAFIEQHRIEEVKKVCGDTSLPLMDIATEWTESKATQEIFAYAKNDKEEINGGKARQCHLYCDPEYKMAFCYIVDGSPKIVPLGVQAIADVLAGDIDASEEDKNEMKARCKTLFERINSQFSSEWIVPWEKKEDEEIKEGSAQTDVLRGIYHALIDQANAIGTQIGETPLSPTQKDIMAVNIPPEDVLALLSILDSQLDMLMRAFGMSAELTENYSIEAQMQRALQAFFVMKEGRELSDKNKRQLKMIHDTVKSMHPGACDSGEEKTESIDHLERQAEIFTQFVKNLEGTTSSDIIKLAVTNALEESLESIEALKAEQDVVVQRLNKLTDMPLGRPTTFVNRTVTPEEGTINTRDFLTGGNLEDALTQTEIIERNGIQFRLWEKGIGGDVSSGVRPRLTDTQKIYMDLMDIPRYNLGERALVPIVN